MSSDLPKLFLVFRPAHGVSEGGSRVLRTLNKKTIQCKGKQNKGRIRKEEIRKAETTSVTDVVLQKLCNPRVVRW